jgi:Ca-activated chloride channel family protein
LLVLAREKLKSQALHDVEVTLTGTPVRDLTETPRRLFHGQQLVVFGQYDEPGTAELTLAVRISGTPQEYTVRFELPELDEELPELERLWAMARIDDLERARDEGRKGEEEANEAIAKLGVAAQIVTEQTSMVLLTEDRFAARGIERRNKARLATETRAQVARAAAPVRSRQVQPTQRVFSRPAPNVATPSRSRPYRGGGALDPFTGALLLGVLGLARRKEDEE